MIYGIGCDLCEIARIEKSLEKNGFASYAFSEAECEAFLSHPRAAQKLAGCFAAKEALGKALGTGISGFSMRDVSVLRNEKGAPYYHFEGKSAAIIKEKGLCASLSLSNQSGFALAFTVLEVQS